MDLFRHILTGMIEHEKMHGGGYQTWENANHAVLAFERTYKGEKPSYHELDITYEAIQLIIDTDGVMVDKAFNLFDQEIYGQTFSSSVVI